MYDTTVPRPDVTSEQVTDTLRRALGSRFHVLPDTAINQRPKDRPRPDHADTIVVGAGSDRYFRAEVTISRTPDRTVLHVTPGGLPGTWPGGLKLVNRLGVARKVHQTLQTAPGLR